MFLQTACYTDVAVCDHILLSFLSYSIFEFPTDFSLFSEEHSEGHSEGHPERHCNSNLASQL